MSQVRTQSGAEVRLSLSPGSGFSQPRVRAQDTLKLEAVASDGDAI